MRDHKITISAPPSAHVEVADHPANSPLVIAVVAMRSGLGVSSKGGSQSKRLTKKGHPKVALK